jgi:hypothetical protein
LFTQLLAAEHFAQGRSLTFEKHNVSALVVVVVGALADPTLAEKASMNTTTPSSLTRSR